MITEQIRGVAICTTAQRRNQLTNFVLNWARREGFDTPSAENAVPDGKYGPGFGLIISVDFPDLATADTAWLDVVNFNPSFILDHSYIQQITDLNDGTPATIRHRFDWINGQRVTTV